ncbi:MAG: sulfite exporter TauE/SafE family protein [Limnohabitans sp.]|jgi:uncharacterized membrane protein YfcA
MSIDSYLILASLGALLIGMSKGGLPMVGMMSVPLLSLVMSPVKAAVLLLPLFVISDVVGVWLYRRQYSAPNLKILIPAGVMGVFIGWLTASMISDQTIKFIIGLVGVGFCLQIWFRRGQSLEPQPANKVKGYFWGIVAGFTSFISHAGGPPFQIYMLPQKLPKAEFAGTATILFAIINLSKILPYQNLSPYSQEDLMKAAVLVPMALLGTYLGAYLTRRINDVWFYKLVQTGLFLVSCKLIWDAVGI